MTLETVLVDLITLKWRHIGLEWALTQCEREISSQKETGHSGRHLGFQCSGVRGRRIKELRVLRDTDTRVAHLPVTGCQGASADRGVCMRRHFRGSTVPRGQLDCRPPPSRTTREKKLYCFQLPGPRYLISAALERWHSIRMSITFMLKSKMYAHRIPSFPWPHTAGTGIREADWHCPRWHYRLVWELPRAVPSHAYLRAPSIWSRHSVASVTVLESDRITHLRETFCGFLIALKKKIIQVPLAGSLLPLPPPHTHFSHSTPHPAALHLLGSHFSL